MLAGLVVCLLVAQGPSVEEPGTLFDRASSLVARGEVRTAIDLLEQAVVADEASGNREHLARDLVSLGLCLSGVGRTDEAVARLVRAVEVWRSLGAPEATVASLEALGTVLCNHSRLDEAYLRLCEAREVARQHGLPEANVEGNLGMVLQAAGKSSEAMEHYQRALTGHERAGDSAAAGTVLGNIANLHLTAGRFPEAQAAYSLAHAAFTRAGDSARATTTTINLGMVSLSQGKYDEARVALEEGHERSRREGWGLLQGSALLHLAGVFQATGLFDRAEAAYLESLKLFQIADNPQNAVAAQTGLAALQLAWGRPDRAMSEATEALELARRHGIQDQVLGSLETIGDAHRASGRFNTAILHFRKALDLARVLGRDAEVGRIEIALGGAFARWGRHIEAEEHFREALRVAERLGQSHVATQAHIFLGAVRQLLGDPQGAREAYLRGLTTSRSSGAIADEAIALGNLGTLALVSGDRREAERFLLEAIAIREKLRLTTKGEDRAAALEVWVSSYRWLVHLYFVEGNTSAVFEASERIRGRQLAETMSEHSSEHPVARFDFEAFRQGLGPSEAIVSFANVDWQHPIAVVATRQAVKAYALDVEGLRKRVGFRETSADDSDAPLGHCVMRRAPSLGGLVTEYRRLLGLVRPSPAERRQRDRLARGLFETLLRPAEDILARAEDVVIIPDGSLSLVPFETLRLPDGRLLITRHHVTYQPSARVMQLLRQRRHPPRARALLAMGGAPHRRRSASTAAAVSPRQMEALRASARRRVESGKGSGEVYSVLGLGPWADLPGARAEVEAIGRIVPESTVLTGNDVSERTLKSLSRDGTLREYKTLHFATHGITVADAPELSALVFAEAGGDGDQEEDGYLGLHEIAALDIRPDLVTLSSCESGLGRIYGGEGTVGLTQAFLGAGANGVAVTLWQVHDTYAREFMIRLYEAVQTQGLSHARAMTATKRLLIRQGKVDPVLWAPFVYYGN